MQISDISELDQICNRLTSFKNFQELLDAPQTYTPSLNVGKRDLRILADFYDKAQESRGDSRRVTRFYILKSNK